MRIRKARFGWAWSSVGLVVLSGGLGPGAAHPMTYDHLTKMQQRLLSGFASSEIDAAGAPSRKRKVRARSASPGPATPVLLPAFGRRLLPTASGPTSTWTPTARTSPTSTWPVAARRRTRPTISEDPTPRVVGSSNDYRRGDGGCFAYTARTTADRSATRDPHLLHPGRPAYGDARGSTGAAGATPRVPSTPAGNAYFSCQVFNRGVPVSANPDLSSALLVFRSTGNGGASYTFPARVVTEQPDVTGTGTEPFLDKQLLTVDNHTSSPFRDRVYVTWTTFAADGTGYIYESHSADYAETWSAPTLSAGPARLCTQRLSASRPRTAPATRTSSPSRSPAPDGTLYVTWANFNNTVTGDDNRNQILLAKSTDGGATFSARSRSATTTSCPTA